MGCLVRAVAVLLVAMALVHHASAACGSVTSLSSCLDAAKNGAQPTAQCCNAMRAFAQNGSPAGQACLCQAISDPLAKQLGAQFQFAILIPQKCNLPFKHGVTCNGVVVPGGQ